MIRKIKRALRDLIRKSNRNLYKCPWCHRPIKGRSKVTCYSLYKEANAKNYISSEIKTFNHADKIFLSVVQDRIVSQTTRSTADLLSEEFWNLMENWK